MDALKYFGVRSEPISFFMMVLNEEAMDLLRSGMTMQELKEHLAPLLLEESGGPWTLGIGANDPGLTGWAGHLGIRVGDHLIDLSADQASRPHKNIVLEASAFLIEDPEWWAGNKKFELFQTSGGVSLLLDRHAPDPDGYRKSKNWFRQSSKHDGAPVFKEVTGKIIRAMKEDLG